MLCPCHSQKPYAVCCERFHSGLCTPDTALELMRSRYSAYALGLVQYIIDTTYKPVQALLAEDIMAFCMATEFIGLEILDENSGQECATVTFRAGLVCDGKEASFREKSYFVKVNDRWLYSPAQSLHF